MKLYNFGIVVVSLLLCSCTATYQLVNVTETPQVKLDPKGKVLISTPEDGRYQTIEYSGSGQMTAQAIKAAFARHSNNVSISSACNTINACLDKAKQQNQTYLLYPEILHWEERATEWSGKPDRIEVKLTLLDVSNEEVLFSSVITGKSKWATFGGDHPQDLLPEPINNYISTFY